MLYPYCAQDTIMELQLRNYPVFRLVTFLMLKNVQNFTLKKSSYCPRDTTNHWAGLLDQYILVFTHYLLSLAS